MSIPGRPWPKEEEAVAAVWGVELVEEEGGGVTSAAAAAGASNISRVTWG